MTEVDPADRHTRPALDAQMRTVLARLELVSHGTTAAISPTTGSQSATVRPGQGHPEGRPAGCAGAEHVYWRARYQEQATDDGRRNTIRGAERELELLTGRYQRQRGAGETPDETIARMLRETQGWTPEDVEHSTWRMSARLVRKHRLVAGHDAETGQPTTLTMADDAEPAQRAREMRDRGMSIRQIAFALRQHKTQVERWVRKAA